jgi:hypothetical protein
MFCAVESFVVDDTLSTIPKMPGGLLRSGNDLGGYK